MAQIKHKVTERFGNFMIIMGVFIMFIGGFLYLMDKLDRNIDIDCLKPKAIEICESRNLIYSAHNVLFVSCKEDLRQNSFERFNFYDEEVEDCIKLEESGE